jgi:hypothetical protein
LKAIGFDGREQHWKMNKCIVSGDDTRPRSNLHISTRKLLNELFPYDTIYEEVPLPGSNKPSRPSKLFADFFVPAYQLIVEVHGRQHFEYVSFFHKTKADFLKSKSRDRDKERWCEINSLNFVALKFSENVDEWKQRILEKL